MCHYFGVAGSKEHAVSDAVEDYVKAIYKLESRGGGAVTTNAVAERLGVTPSSVSAMFRRLDETGLATLARYRGVHLTEEGRQLALRVLRRHRLLEQFLAEVLDLSWDRVHDEAEVLEHVLSPELEEVIAAKLGHPVRDPHGDPIPTRDGRVVEDHTQVLAALEAGATGRLVRVSDFNPEMLRYLTARGVSLGDRIAVIEQQPFGGALLVRFGDQDQVHSIGGDLAKAMRVELQA